MQFPVSERSEAIPGITHRPRGRYSDRWAFPRRFPQRDKFGHRMPALADDDLFSGFYGGEKLGEVRFGIMHGYFDHLPNMIARLS